MTRRARYGAAIAALVATLALGCGSAGGRTASAPGARAPAVRSAEHDAREPGARVSAAGRSSDWPMFGRTPSRPSSTSASIGITAAEAPRLRRQSVALPGTVDSAPIFLADVHVGGAARDAFLMTTTYGRTLAVDARSGRILWTFTPGSYRSLAGSYRITNASPVASSDRRFVFAASPDGRVHKLRVDTGREVDGRWPVSVTRLSAREKITSPFSIVNGRLVVATGGYIGDAPPYQGHVVTIDPGSGRIVAVFNSLCADRHRLIAPSSCPASDSAIWARGGVVEAPDGSLLFATGNAPFDGRRNFGDSVVRLSSSGRRLLGSWTPRGQAQLDVTDTDLGSTAPVPIGGGSVLQGGKDARLHVIAFAALRHVGVIGGERQVLGAPGGAGVFTAPAVWRTRGRTFVFVTTGSGTAGYESRGGRLHELWANGTGGTSPLVAGGLLYVYDPGGALVIYRPVTGQRIARLPAGGGHWSSPVPGRGVIALPVGNANDHATSGTLELYRVS